ncbi:MerR family DNA-binding transcriptional regulator [Tessaracoccus sp. HDW20]|uniref:MerR family DNA-binding transcriptional regulator n=1 Tax=Tessaracoccus coleopterorum TaxID=2714950 RepID=UPI0018D41625|nr:MerR family DNA-binding transcriptional regulator [Tessaracoccus coleopterorum]
MVTIGQAARLTGVAEHTLRAWERRYGVFQPVRTGGGYRVYGRTRCTGSRPCATWSLTGCLPARRRSACGNSWRRRRRPTRRSPRS